MHPSLSQFDAELVTKALPVTRRLAEAGYRALWAGGCVRDVLLGRKARDIDVATDATPDQVASLFPRSIPTGKAFGVMTIPVDGSNVEIATFRRDVGIADGRRPESVDFCDEKEDALRRDFTINALFYDPLKEEVIDYVDGRSDLEKQVIRTVGDPLQRYREDYLRMLRAIRFSSVLQFDIEPATWAGICELAEDILKISWERVRMELTILLTESPLAGQGLFKLMECGLLKQILPEVEACFYQEQPPQFHPEGDVLTHTAMMLDLMETPADPRLAYSVLFHDIGKPPTAKIGPGADGVPRIRFDGHPSVGAHMAHDILKRLRCSRADIEFITYCVKHHMRFMDVPNMRKAKLRRLVGAETFPVEHALHRLDCLASHGDLTNYSFLQAYVEELAAEPVLPERWITGTDLLALGLRPGPELGQWLTRAYDRQIDGTDPDRPAQLDWLKSQIDSSES